MPSRVFKHGEIFSVDFGEESIGHEYKKRRPGIIIQSDEIMKSSNLVTVLPLTSNLVNQTVDDISILKDDKNLLLSDSLIKVNHIMSFDYQRFYHKIGETDEKILLRIKQYLKTHFGL